MQNDLQAEITTRDFELVSLSYRRETRWSGRNAVDIWYANKDYAWTGFSAITKDFRSIAGKYRARVMARNAMKASRAHHKP
jgi:hypothetical protein